MALILGFLVKWVADRLLNEFLFNTWAVPNPCLIRI